MQTISLKEKKTNESVRMENGIEDETLQQTEIRRKGFWTCYAVRWIGKMNDAGIRRRKMEKRATKDKVDG